MKKDLKTDITRFMKRLLALGAITTTMFAAGCKGPDGPPLPQPPTPSTKETAQKLLANASLLEGTILPEAGGASAYAIGLDSKIGQELLAGTNENLLNWYGVLYNEGAATCKVIFVDGHVEDHEIESWAELIGNDGRKRDGFFVLECPEHPKKYVLVTDQRARDVYDNEVNGLGTVRRGLQDIHDENALGRLPRTPAMAEADAKKSLSLTQE